jgi:hypothetical protein
VLWLAKGLAELETVCWACDVEAGGRVSSAEFMMRF